VTADAAPQPPPVGTHKVQAESSSHRSSQVHTLRIRVPHLHHHF
jgi:hypothetical protein